MTFLEFLDNNLALLIFGGTGMLSFLVSMGIVLVQPLRGEK